VAIEDFLRRLQSNLFVDFAVSAPSLPGAKGEVFVGGRWLPTMRMDWVVGSVLGAAVEKRLASPSQLGVLRQELLRYARLSEQNGFAHGDIHPDNILVTDAGAMRFVDYDGMYVRALSGLRSPIAGQPDYQSPVRSRIDPNAFGAWLDRFPLLVLDLSLAALQARPDLIKRKTGDGLLLGRSDFDAPERSQLLAEIARIRGLGETVHLFREACRMPLQQVPTLDAFRATEGRGPIIQVNLPKTGTLRYLHRHAVLMLAGCALLIGAVVVGPRIYHSIEALMVVGHEAVITSKNAYPKNWTDGFRVHIRRGPGTQFPFFDEVPEGTRVKIIGVKRGGRLRRDSVSVPLSGSSAGWVNPYAVAGASRREGVARPE
jgi:hypothetical protein